MMTLSATDSEKQHQNLPVKIYCDGSAVPNPGTMGIGLVYGNLEHVYSACLGSGTNQIAELFALFAAITLADLNDFIFTDSRYAVKVARCEWRAHCYQDLISEIRNGLEFKRIRLQWIHGHAGHLLQQRADRVANRAARKRRPRIDPQEATVSAWIGRIKTGLIQRPVASECVRMVNQADVGLTSGRSGEHAESGVSRVFSNSGSLHFDGAVVKT
jgi:ribonuclease HI